MKMLLAIYSRPQNTFHTNLGSNKVDNSRYRTISSTFQKSPLSIILGLQNSHTPKAQHI